MPDTILYIDAEKNKQASYQLIRPSPVLIFLENQNKSNLKVSSVESTADCRLENREYKVSLNKYQKLV